MTKTARRKFAKRLAEVRGPNRSQRRFAHDVGISQQNMNRFFHGALPSFETLVKISKAEQCSLDWLMLGADY